MAAASSQRTLQFGREPAIQNVEAVIASVCACGCSFRSSEFTGGGVMESSGGLPLRVKFFKGKPPTEARRSGTYQIKKSSMQQAFARPCNVACGADRVGG